MIKAFLICALFCASAQAIFLPPEQAEKAKRSDAVDFVLRNVPVIGISEGDFNLKLDRIESYYQPIVAKKGYSLQFNRKWTDGTVNSDTTVEGRVWSINSYGGLARRQFMTPNGYLMVAAHELCHHLGQAPCYDGRCNWGGGGPANEGESDYCASRVMKELGLTSAEIDAAALSTASVLASLGGESAPQIGQPDLSQVARTNDAHPRANCRLTTYVAGNRCSASGEFSPTDPKVNSCYSYPGGIADAGSRPRCWFKPTDQGTSQPAPTPVPTPPKPQPVPAPQPAPPPICKKCSWICV